jgi:hypothetical protein
MSVTIGSRARAMKTNPSAFRARRQSASLYLVGESMTNRKADSIAEKGDDGRNVTDWIGGEHAPAIQIRDPDQQL